MKLFQCTVSMISLLLATSCQHINRTSSAAASKPFLVAVTEWLDGRSTFHVLEDDDIACEDALDLWQHEVLQVRVVQRLQGPNADIELTVHRIGPRSEPYANQHALMVLQYSPALNGWLLLGEEWVVKNTDDASWAIPYNTNDNLEAEPQPMHFDPPVVQPVLPQLSRYKQHDMREDGWRLVGDAWHMEQGFKLDQVLPRLLDDAHFEAKDLQHIRLIDTPCAQS